MWDVRQCPHKCTLGKAKEVRTSAPSVSGTKYTTSAEFVLHNSLLALKFKLPANFSLWVGISRGHGQFYN
ncbi:unnamed protein product [Camellia sinensis]